MTWSTQPGLKRSTALSSDYKEMIIMKISSVQYSRLCTGTLEAWYTPLSALKMTPEANITFPDVPKTEEVKRCATFPS